jgi:hypothetical protein
MFTGIISDKVRWPVSKLQLFKTRPLIFHFVSLGTDKGKLLRDEDRNWHLLQNSRNWTKKKQRGHYYNYKQHQVRYGYALQI